MDEDWRVRINFADQQTASEHAARLEAKHVELDEEQQLGGRVVASRDGADLFLYAAAEDDARLVAQIATSDLQKDQWPADVQLERWHEAAEDWERADAPLPRTDDERAAERARLMRREDAETSAQGYAEWEVRVELPDHRAARELSERLDQEGVSHVRRWRYVLVGATDEDAAQEWAKRLRGEAPAGSRVSVEGTFAAVERHNPFAVFSGVAGGP